MPEQRKQVVVVSAFGGGSSLEDTFVTPEVDRYLHLSALGGSSLEDTLVTPEVGCPPPIPRAPLESLVVVTGLSTLLSPVPSPCVVRG